MRHTFAADQWLPYPVEQVFAFFANPQNLPPLMPKWQKARIEEASLTPPPPQPESGRRTVAAGVGSRISISFRPFPYSPIRIPWDAEITEFAWNDHFCDHQNRGPFAYWHHCHSLTAETRDNQPGTLIHDHVDYEMYLGPLGDVANALGGRYQISKIFDFRHERTAVLIPLMRQG